MFIDSKKPLEGNKENIRSEPLQKRIKTDEIINTNNPDYWIEEIVTTIKDCSSHRLLFYKFNYIIKNNLIGFSSETINHLILSVINALNEKKDSHLEKALYRGLVAQLHLKKVVVKEFPLPLRIQVAKHAFASFQPMDTIVGYTSISKNIKDFGINSDTEEGQKGLIKIAKKAARQDPALPKFIHTFGIQKETEAGQKALIEIAKITAKRSGGMTCLYLENFGIRSDTEAGQIALIEIAKICAQAGAAFLPEYLNKFKIQKDTVEGQKVLIELAMLAAKKNGGVVSSKIKKI